MSTEVTPDFLRGFLVPFPFTSSNFWADESSLTQNGSTGGNPTPFQPSSLVLTTNGAQSKTIQVDTVRGGHVQDGAGFGWKYKGDANLYGWEPPNKVMDLEMLLSPVGFNEYIPRAAQRITDGTILIALENIGATTNTIRIGRVDVDGSFSHSAVDTVDTTALLGQLRYPALCEMPDASIILVAWAIDEIKETANMKVWRSIDAGTTFSLVSSKALPTDIDISGSPGSGAGGNDLERITLAANESQVLMFASIASHNTDPAFRNIVRQYASTSEGLVYRFIAESSPSDGFYLPDIVEYNGVFIISYIESTDALAFTRITNAFSNVFSYLGAVPADTLSGLFANISSKLLQDGNKTMYIDTDGRLYLYAMLASGNHLQMVGVYSDVRGVGVDDYANNWNIFNGTVTTNANVIDLQSPAGPGAGGIINICGASGQGEQLIFGNWNPTGTNAFAKGLHRIAMGGWASQQYPKMVTFPEDKDWGYNVHDWMPVDLPQQGGTWTRTTSGAPTETLGGDHITLTCGVGDTVKYNVGIGDKTAGCLIHTKITNITAGTISTGTGFGVQIQQDTTTNTYWAEVVVRTDGIYLYDVYAGYGSPLASATGLDLSNGVELILAVDNATGDVVLYYAVADKARQYQSIFGTLITNASTTQQIYWGIATNSTTAACDFHYFSYGLGSANGQGIEDGLINAKQYSPRGYYTQITDGLLLSTLDGPAREGDSYSITPQYTAPIERTLHTVSPSVQVGWRSDAVTNPDTTDVPQEQIAWVLDTTLLGTVNTHVASEMVGIHLEGINFRDFEIQRYNAGVGWTTYQAVSNDVGGSFPFSRLGAAIQGNAVNGTYLHHNECAGWHILLDDGAGNVVQRRIKSNGEGVWAITNSKRAYLVLENAQSTDPTSGTAYLIPSSCTVLLNRQDMAGMRIQINAQRTATGYFEIGTMVMGEGHIPGNQYSRGRTMTWEAQVLENTGSNGVLYSQPNGRGGRIGRIAWSDGVDTSKVFDVQADPDYWKFNTSNRAIAAVGSAPTSMMGLVQYINGSNNAVVYLPAIKTNAGYQMLNRYHNHMLCTFGNDVQIESVLGGEMLGDGKGEVMRVSTIVMREVR